MTLTLDFHGQILKKSYLRNGMVDWHGMKGMRIDKMVDPCCDFQLWPHPWPWPWIFKVKYWNCCISGMGGSTHLERKGCKLDLMVDAQWDSPWATVHGKLIGRVMGQCETLTVSNLLAHEHRWPSTQPGSLHTALQHKDTQSCSLYSRGMAVWTMGARLCEQWGTAVCKCPAV